jgi:hypothetical protein
MDENVKEKSMRRRVLKLKTRLNKEWKKMIIEIPKKLGKVMKNGGQQIPDS